jgi:F0F1-type ATP synthase membrane subunit c/vacuolar-type H+-ATPase subunit K
MKLAIRAVLTVVVLLVVADLSMAQPNPAPNNAPVVTAPAVKYTGIGAGIGVGLSIVGAGIGIGLIGFAALAGIARQPEQTGTIRGVMILMAALVEGAALIGAVLCFVMGFIGT